MILDVRTIALALYLTFSRRRVTVRRTAFVMIVLALYFLLRLVVALGHLLDFIFFRGFGLQEVRSPIFIIAPPRSGTTFLHNLMCLDEERFTHFKTYQTLLPAISLYKLVRILGPVSRRLGILHGINHWLGQRAFKGWRNIHPIRLGQAEEDEGIFLYTLHTPAFYMLFPFPREFRYLQFLDNMDDKSRHRVMGYYKRCVQRHLYASPSDRTLLTKNVHSLGRIETLLESFPDAKFIFVTRDACQAIPSLISLYYTMWHGHSPDIPQNSPESHSVAQMGFDYYRYLMEMCRRLPRDQFISIGYDKLLADPEGSVGRIYKHFGLPMSEAFKVRLRQSARENSSYESCHSYSLEDYGLSRLQVYEQLDEVLEFFGQASVPPGFR
jgi:omega-hydroxy-beta-dihydromenaquinone-9 sulfotransferase